MILESTKKCYALPYGFRLRVSYDTSSRNRTRRHERAKRRVNVLRLHTDKQKRCGNVYRCDKRFTTPIIRTQK